MAVPDRKRLWVNCDSGRWNVYQRLRYDWRWISEKMETQVDSKQLGLQEWVMGYLCLKNGGRDPLRLAFSLSLNKHQHAINKYGTAVGYCKLWAESDAVNSTNSSYVALVWEDGFQSAARSVYLHIKSNSPRDWFGRQA